jgi:hypothetical protein
VKILRVILLALLFSLLVGFAIGTVIRLRLEKPVYYIGEATPHQPGRAAGVDERDAREPDRIHRPG